MKKIYVYKGKKFTIKQKPQSFPGSESPCRRIILFENPPKKELFSIFVEKSFVPAYNMRRKEGVPHTKDRGKEKGEPKQLQHEKSVKGKNIMKRTRTPKRSALSRKMTALFLTLVLLLPLFCFGSYALEEDAEPEINGYQAVINETHYIYANMLIDTTTLLGISGRSGVEEASYPAHLHVGVFLAPENQSTFSSAEWNSNALNPLLFYTPDDYDVKP